MTTPGLEPSQTYTFAASSADPMTVRRLGFGAMRITGPGIWGDPADRGTAIEVLRRAVELGVDFIDTADSYGPEVSEDLIREALYPYEGLLIATKGGLTRQGPDQWGPVGRPEYLRQCVHMSLRRLGLERIDLWQLHRIDSLVSLEDQFGVIKDMQAEGLIRHVGISEVTVAELVASQAIVDIVSVQNLYNAGNRSRSAPRALHRQRHRVHPVVPARQPSTRCPGRSACRYRSPARLHASAGGTRLAAAAFAGHAPDPGHRVGRACRGELRCVRRHP